MRSEPRAASHRKGGRDWNPGRLQTWNRWAASSESRHHVVPKPAATQSAAPADVGTDVPSNRTLPTATPRAAPMAGPAVSRHPLEVRTVCLNWARTDLCGGRGEILVPTAIKTLSRAPTPFCWRKATRMGTTSRVPIWPGVVEEPGMCRCSLSLGTGRARVSTARSKAAGPRQEGEEP